MTIKMQRYACRQTIDPRYWEIVLYDYIKGEYVPIKGYERLTEDAARRLSRELNEQDADYEKEWED